VSCENKYSLFDRIFFSLVLNISSKVEVFLFDNFKFQDSTNEDDSNNISNFLSSNNKCDLDQNNVDKNNNLVEKFRRE
jgi:hypothetical protein